MNDSILKMGSTNFASTCFQCGVVFPIFKKTWIILLRPIPPPFALLYLSPSLHCPESWKNRQIRVLKNVFVLFNSANLWAYLHVGFSHTPWSNNARHLKPIAIFCRWGTSGCPVFRNTTAFMPIKSINWKYIENVLETGRHLFFTGLRQSGKYLSIRQSGIVKIKSSAKKDRQKTKKQIVGKNPFFSLYFFIIHIYFKN